MLFLLVCCLMMPVKAFKGCYQEMRAGNKLVCFRLQLQCRLSCLVYLDAKWLTTLSAARSVVCHTKVPSAVLEGTERCFKGVAQRISERPSGVVSTLPAAAAALYLAPGVLAVHLSENDVWGRDCSVDLVAASCTGQHRTKWEREGGARPYIFGNICQGVLHRLQGLLHLLEFVMIVLVIWLFYIPV